MKFSLLLLLILASGYQLKAQTDAEIQDKSKGYIETRGLNKVTIRAIPLAFGSVPFTATQLIVVDDKIFKGTDPALRNIAKDSLEFVKRVKDETSASGIQDILFYRTKVQAKK